jgi:hypothetical protein
MKYLFIFALIFFQSSDNIVIKIPWIRPAPATFNTAFYCIVVNNSSEPDTLYNAASNISDRVEIHETYKKGDMTGMRRINSLTIAPHDSLIFKPGSYHIMVMNLKENVEANQVKEITLFFKQSGKIIVKAEVKK